MRRLRVVQDRLLRHHAVGHDDELAGLGAQLGGAPRDLLHLALVLADADPWPTRNGFSTWIARPAKRLPSVSCSAKPTTTAPTADVVSSFSRGAPWPRREERDDDDVLDDGGEALGRPVVRATG